MKNSTRVLAALVGLAAVSTTALAQNGRGNRGTSRNTCPTPAYRGDRGSNVGFSISIGNTRGFNTWSNRGFNRGFGHHNGYWGNNRGFSRAGHDFWIGSRSFNHGSFNRGWRQPVIHRPAVVYTAPVVRQSPVIVERPVVIERPVYQQPTFTQPTYTRPVVRETIREVPVYRDIVPQDPRTRYQAGWNALAAGDPGYARSYFADQAVLRPDDPTPKAGLAIARAAGGLDDQAEWAMRRAVRANLSQARADLPVYELEAQLTAIESRFAERSATYNDRWFMLAATRYLLGDTAGAKQAANQALSFDERDAEARRIYDLVTQAG